MTPHLTAQFEVRRLIEDSPLFRDKVELGFDVVDKVAYKIVDAVVRVYGVPLTGLENKQEHDARIDMQMRLREGVAVANYCRNLRQAIVAGTAQGFPEQFTINSMSLILMVDEQRHRREPDFRIKP